MCFLCLRKSASEPIEPEAAELLPLAISSGRGDVTTAFSSPRDGSARNKDELCAVAKMASIRFVGFNHNFNSAIYLSGALYNFLLLTMPNQTELEQCGINGKGYNTLNTMLFTVMPLFILFCYLPVRNAVVAKGFEHNAMSFAKTLDTHEEIVNSTLDSLSSYGFAPFLLQQFKQNQKIVEIFLYIITSRGFIKALLLLLGKKYNAENLHWITKKIKHFIATVDKAIIAPLFDGVDFATSMVAFVFVLINYFYNARHNNPLKNNEVISFYAAIVGITVGIVMNLVDKYKAIPASLKIKQSIELFFDQTFYYINLLVMFAMCANGAPVMPAEFKNGAAQYDSILGLLMGLNLLYVAANHATPALTYHTADFNLPSRLKDRVIYNIRWVVNSALGGTGIAELSKKSLDELYVMLRSTEQLARHQRPVIEEENDDD